MPVDRPLGVGSGTPPTHHAHARPGRRAGALQRRAGRLAPDLPARRAASPASASSTAPTDGPVDIDEVLRECRDPASIDDVTLLLLRRDRLSPSGTVLRVTLTTNPGPRLLAREPLDPADRARARRTARASLIGAPHTSNWDFILMLAIAGEADLHVSAGWASTQLFRGPGRPGHAGARWHPGRPSRPGRARRRARRAHPGRRPLLPRRDARGHPQRRRAGSRGSTASRAPRACRSRSGTSTARR